MAFLNEMLQGFGEIFASPFKSIDALWIIIPLFLIWIVLEIYFARFKKEELGWNTALANGITLGWLTLEGMRSLFSVHPDNFWMRFLANIVILMYASLIVYVSFTHKIKSKWNFMLASPTPVYFLGIFSVVWGFGTLEINRYVLLDLVILFIVISIGFAIFRRMMKPADEGDEGMPKMPEEPGLGGGLPPLEGFGEGLERGFGNTQPTRRNDFGGLPPL